MTLLPCLLLSFISIFSPCSANTIYYSVVPLKNHTQFPAITRIVGGTQATIHDFPWQTSVMACIGTKCQVCGGSLISTRFILTAAHCTADYNKFDIGLGSNTLRSPALKLFSTEKIEHADYNSELLKNDIALIKLPVAVKLTTSIKTIALANSKTGSLENSQALVSGFGKTSDFSPVSSTLNFLKMKIISNQECSSYYGPTIITSSLLCAKGETNSNNNVCQGDSGGPLVVKNGKKYVQVGVVSFVGKKGCSSGYPSGYTRVSAYQAWIKQKTGVK